MECKFSGGNKLENKDIADSIGKTILECNSDVLMDIAELSIDEILADSVLKEIPFIKTVYSLVKTGLAIRDKHMAKKTLIFIQKLLTNDIEEKAYEEYREKLNNKDPETYKQLEYITIILDKLIETEKSKVFANLYTAFVNKKITTSEFQNLSTVLNNFLLFDLTNLKLLYEQDRKLENMEDKYGSANRLISQGLAYQLSGFSRSPLSGNISFNPPQNDISLTEFGRMFYKYGFLE